MNLDDFMTHSSAVSNQVPNQSLSVKSRSHISTRPLVLGLRSNTPKSPENDTLLVTQNGPLFFKIPPQAASNLKTLKSSDFHEKSSPKQGRITPKKVGKFAPRPKIPKSLITFSKVPKRPCPLAALIVKFTK